MAGLAGSGCVSACTVIHGGLGACVGEGVWLVVGAGGLVGGEREGGQGEGGVFSVFLDLLLFSSVIMLWAASISVCFSLLPRFFFAHFFAMEKAFS